ncbi:MAG: ImuA family protein [Rhodospirillales bacterium]
MPTRPAAGESDRAARLAALREEVRRLEGVGGTDVATVPLGCPPVDGALPDGGLTRGALHEIAGDAGAATGFAVWLAVRLAAAGAGSHRPVVWVARRPDLYAPGLAALGLDPARLLVVAARRADEVLWTMEEALGCRGLGAVVGEGASPDMTASRRLQLAAEGSGVPALTLAPGEKALRTSAAVTRWTVHPAPGPAEEPGLGPLRWRLSLLRCRGGRPGAWTVDLRDGRLDPVADAGTAEATPLRAAG